jgi:hypothetical protein
MTFQTKAEIRLRRLNSFLILCLLTVYITSHLLKLVTSLSCDLAFLAYKSDRFFI